MLIVLGRRCRRCFRGAGVLRALVGPVHGGGRGFGFRAGPCGPVFEHEKGIWWMPWRQEALKDVARCENSGGAASRL